MGQQLKAFIVNQGNCLVEVIELSESDFTLKIKQRLQSFETIPGQATTPASLTLLVGLSRPQTIKKVLELGTTMGVSRFLFVPAELSEKSYGTSKVFGQVELEKHLLLGLAQSACLFQLPEVHVLKSSRQIEKYVENSKKYLCSLTDKHERALLPKDSSEAITIAIGPERGWTNMEEENFLKLGFQRLGLYSTTLRVEAAVVSALTQWFLGLESKHD